MKRKPKKADKKAEPLTLYRADSSWILAICTVCYHCMKVAMVCLALISNA